MPEADPVHEPWDFRVAVSETLLRVAAERPEGTWYVARIAGADATILAAIGPHADGLCDVVHETADLLARSEHSAPLVDHRRGTIGIVGGLAHDRGDAAGMPGGLDYHAGMLSSVLAAELRAEEEQRRAERAELVAMVDPLTGAANRRGWEALLGAEEARCERYGDPAAVLVVKLGALAHVNETYGIVAGDEVLRLTTQVLEGCLREPDAVARLSGNEFGVLAVDCDHDRAERLGVRLEAALLDNGVSTTVGVAVRGPQHRHLVDAWRAAEVAMFALRRERELLRRQHALRPDRLLVAQQPWPFEPPEVAPPLRAVSPETLTTAVAAEQFRLHLQPVVALGDASVRGAEALLRWQHPTRGLIGPGEFLAVAETAGAIVPIGKWVVNQACDTIARLGDAGYDSDCFVAANVSIHQLEDPDFAASVVETVVAAGIEPARLHIEVTETLPLGDSLAMSSNLATLRSCGVVVALDDFGTRYATLETLLRCPLDVVKIDRVFVDRVTVDPVARGLVAAVVNLCAEVGIEVVAEGVETREQADILIELGCPYAQGYYFGRPVPAEQFLLSAPVAAVS